jgi:hypothetical protein
MPASMSSAIGSASAAGSSGNGSARGDAARQLEPLLGLQHAARQLVEQVGRGCCDRLAAGPRAKGDGAGEAGEGLERRARRAGRLVQAARRLDAGDALGDGLRQLEHRPPQRLGQGRRRLDLQPGGGAQLGGEGGHRRVALLGPLGASAGDGLAQRRGELGERRLLVRPPDLDQRAGEGRLPGGALVGEDAQRVLVAPGVAARVFAPELGRHVVGRADLAAIIFVLGEARQPEVEELGLEPLAARGHHDVRRLEVAVDDALVVRRLHHVADLVEQRHQPLRRQRPLLSR